METAWESGSAHIIHYIEAQTFSCKNEKKKQFGLKGDFDVECVYN